MTLEAPSVSARAAVSYRPGGTPELTTVTLLPPHGADVLVDIEAVSLCHADIAANQGDFPVSFPIVLGHEGVGVVRAVGPGVQRLTPGDRVILSYDYCGTCSRCAAGHPTQCIDYMQHNFPTIVPTNPEMTADDVDIQSGFFGQSSLSTVARASERNAIKVETTLPASVLAPLGCGIQTGVGAILNIARPHRNDSVVIVGLGAVGFAALMAARMNGVRTIVALDVNEERLSLARELGASETLNARDGDWAEVTKRRLGAGADAAVDCSGAPGALASTLACLRPGGTAVVVGVPPFGTLSLLDVASIVNNSLTIRGTVEGDSLSDKMLPFLVAEAEAGRLPVDRLIRQYAFTDFAQAFEDMSRGSVIKPVLVMS